MQYEEARKRLEEFSGTKDLDGFEKLAEEIASNWDQQKAQEYFALMRQICDGLSSINFADYARRSALRQEYATMALAKPGEIPLETELQLLIHAQPDTAAATTDGGREWAKQRSRVAVAWLRLGQRIEQAINPTFDFNDVPQTNIAPPPGARGLPGMSPDAIDDPALRAEYEGAIERNRQKAENYNEQRQLSDLSQRYSPLAEQYLVSAYSRPPFALDELSHYLEMYVADESKRKSIVTAVEQQLPQT